MKAGCSWRRGVTVEDSPTEKSCRRTSFKKQIDETGDQKTPDRNQTLTATHLPPTNETPDQSMVNEEPWPVQKPVSKNDFGATSELGENHTHGRQEAPTNRNQPC
jgi:hypothetical protein